MDSTVEVTIIGAVSTGGTAILVGALGIFATLRAGDRHVLLYEVSAE